MRILLLLIVLAVIGLTLARRLGEPPVPPGSRLRESALRPPGAGLSGRRMASVADVMDERARHDGQEHGNDEVFHRMAPTMRMSHRNRSVPY